MEKINVNKININGTIWYSWSEFLLVARLKNRKSIYDRVKSGKAERMKVGSASFFRVL